MRVILINPPVLEQRAKSSIFPVLSNLFFNSPPLGLAYIAAVLERENIPVSIIDATVERLSLPRLVNRIKSYDPDIIGITSTTNLFDSAVETAATIKENFLHAKLILGGPHISANPYHALSSGLFDVGVIGEGELTFLELIKALKNEHRPDYNTIKGLVFRKNGDVVFTEPRKFIEPLDRLPYPARHLLPMDRYIPQPNDQYLLPKLSMIASRGCPYSCIFCDKNIFGQRYRSFSPQYIVSEMEHLINRYGAKDIAFLDSTFMVSQQRVEEIIKEMKKRNVRVRWTCTVRANVASKGLLKKMKDAGCWRVRVGIESGNDEILKFIKKGITTQQVKEVTRWAHQLGLQPKGFFMIGHLVDTKDTIEETVRFAKSLPLKDVTVQINTPMYNTPQFEMYQEYGTLITQNCKRFSYWEPVFVPRGLSREYLLRAYSHFYRSFYLRPIIVWRHLREIRHWYNVTKYVRSLNLIVQLFFARYKKNDD